MGWQDAPAVEAPAWASAPSLDDPTSDMTTGQRLRAGMGQGMSTAGRAIAALVGESPLGSLNRAANRALLPPELAARFSLPDKEQAAQAAADARAVDAPLMRTTSGKVGSALGMASVAAPTALIPGANTYLGAGLIGAGAGGLTTEGDLADRGRGALFGAAGGVVGKGIGDGLGTGARWIADRLANRAAAANATAAPRMAAAAAGAREGYVVPPADLQPGMVTEALSGLSGKIKTAQVASQRNQEVTNELARRALGLQPGQQIDAAALQTLRNTAATSGYAPIRAAGQVQADKAFSQALDTIAGQYQGAARSFPGAAKNPVLDMVEGLRQPTFDAGDAIDMIKVLRETADKAYRTGDTGLGKASKSAAGALEDQLERHLTASGNKGALQAFREARQLIAKTYSVQKGLNPTTGDVSAQTLAKDLTKGRPLSGELRTAAEFAAAFPKATQALKEAPKATSPLDWAMGAGGLGIGSPALAAMAAARPAARAALLSPLYQQAAMRGASPGLLGQAPAMLLDQNLTRQAAPGLLGVLAPWALTSE